MSADDDPVRAALDELRRRPLLDPRTRLRKLVFWGVRQVLLAGVAWRYWHLPWMRWVCLVGAALAVVHLGMLLFAQRWMDARLRRVAPRLGQAGPPKGTPGG